MAVFDEPNISITKKTNEQNMAIVKSYLSNLADTLNYMEKRVESLEKRLSLLESEE